jgi:SPP1 gp7 family putative phage head morphogenesis protein
MATERQPVDLKYAIGLEPEKAIRYFESKGYQLGFKWQDVWAEAHARAFTVAGVMKVDVLQDIRQALADALKNGKTFEQFKDQLAPVLRQKGWLGHGDVIDGNTGEIQGRRLAPRRLQTIFQANMQSSYMAGRFAAQMEQVGTRPWWEYVAVMDNRTRPAHAALNGSIFRYDDPFWNTFYPPCGYRCRCRVRTRSRGDIDRNDLSPRSSNGHRTEIQQPVGRTGETRPAIAYQDPITGKRIAPDPGFGFNPGREWQRPFTPPPLDTLPRTFPRGVDLPDLPTPAASPASALLPTGLAPEQYADAFLKVFGGGVGKPLTYTDVSGEALQINEWLFQDSAGHWKADKFGRGPYMELLASAVTDPDEIWLAWVQLGDTWVLRRRYVRALENADGDFGLAIFEQGTDGWTGVTAFPPKLGKSAEARRDYVDSQRGAFLRWRRPQK